MAEEKKTSEIKNRLFANKFSGPVTEEGFDINEYSEADRKKIKRRAIMSLFGRGDRNQDGPTDPTAGFTRQPKKTEAAPAAPQGPMAQGVPKPMPVGTNPMEVRPLPGREGDPNLYGEVMVDGRPQVIQTLIGVPKPGQSGLFDNIGSGVNMTDWSQLQGLSNNNQQIGPPSQEDNKQRMLVEALGGKGGMASLRAIKPKGY